MVYDTHTHAWGPPTPAHPWTNEYLVGDLAGQYATDIVYTAEKLLDDMDDAGVDRAVVVGFPVTDWRDNWYTIKATAEHDRLTGIGLIDPFADDAGETVRTVLSHDDMLGFRLGVLYPDGQLWSAADYERSEWLRDALERDEFWNAAIETDAVVQLFAHFSQLDQILELVDAYPDLRYVLDHFLKAGVADLPGHLEQLERLAEYENVAMKLSEVQNLSARDHPYEDTHEHLRWLLERFGPGRLLWGSDFPNVSRPTYGSVAYEETYTWLDAVPFLSDADRRALRHETAVAFLEG